MKDFAAELTPQRLRNQRLTRTTFRSSAEVVGWLGAVQSQDYAGAKWGLAQRATGLTDAVVEQAFNDGAILRTHIAAYRFWKPAKRPFLVERQ